jgi:type I restriction enzyme S subunit
MGLKPGYKQTEMGVIPEDWEVERLDSITEPSRPISYGIVQTGPNLSNGIRCIRVVDVGNGRINEVGLINTSKQISESYKRTILQANDLIMPLRGKVGDLAVVVHEFAGCNLTRGLALLAILGKYSHSYCAQFIRSSATRARLDQSMNGSALQEIPIATLRSFKIARPPTREEQEAIAEALSDADALIESLEQLLAKKRHLKQGAMQELLTGKKRLPGFGEEWKIRQIGDIMARIANGAVYKATTSYGFSITRIETIADGSINYSRTGTAEATAELENYKMETGDILFRACSH